MVEAVGLRKTGERVPMEVAFSVVQLGGEPAVVAFLRDIRERRQIQTRLAFADRMATLGMLAAGWPTEIVTIRSPMRLWASSGSRGSSSR